MSVWERDRALSALDVAYTKRSQAARLTEPALDLLAALQRLSPKQRACVVLHHLGGYPVKDIATIVGSTSAAVKVHLSQSRKRLRSWLEQEPSDA